MSKRFLQTLLNYSFVLLLFITLIPSLQAQNKPTFSFDFFECDEVLEREIKEDLEICDEQGRLKVSYTVLDDSLLLRKTYVPAGKIRQVAEVYRVWSSDTVYTEDFDTGVMELTVRTGYWDVLHGKLVEYEHFGQEIMLKGQMKNGKRVGMWTKSERAYGGNRETATYNSDGFLDGPYQLYHALKDGTLQVHWEGQYAHSVFPALTADFDTGEMVYREELSSQRVGSWKQYSPEGKLVQTINYMWNLNP